MERLKDINGKESSKRKLGIRYLMNGLVMCWFYLIFDVALQTYQIIKKFKTADAKSVIEKIELNETVLISVLAVGTSLLGITLFEKFKGALIK